jgi:hypothetical protein
VQDKENGLDAGGEWVRWPANVTLRRASARLGDQATWARACMDDIRKLGGAQEAAQGHGNAAMDGRSTRARHTGECGTSTTAKWCEAPGGHACGMASVAAREVASCSGTAHGCAEPSEACDTSEVCGAS